MELGEDECCGSMRQCRCIINADLYCPSFECFVVLLSVLFLPEELLSLHVLRVLTIIVISQHFSLLFSIMAVAVALVSLHFFVVLLTITLVSLWSSLDLLLPLVVHGSHIYCTVGLGIF